MHADLLSAWFTGLGSHPSEGSLFARLVSRGKSYAGIFILSENRFSVRDHPHPGKKSERIFRAQPRWVCERASQQAGQAGTCMYVRVRTKRTPTARRVSVAGPTKSRGRKNPSVLRPRIGTCCQNLAATPCNGHKKDRYPSSGCSTYLQTNIRFQSTIEFCIVKSWSYTLVVCCYI